MLRLALSTLRTRKIGFAGSFAAVTLAITLIAAVLTLLTSGLRATPSADRFGATAAVVRMDPDLHLRDTAIPLDRPARLPAEVVTALRTTPGVRAVVTDTPFYAQAAGQKGGQGHAWSAAALTPFTLRAGTAPSGPDDVVVDSDTARQGRLRPGSPVRIVTEEGVRGYRVSGVTRTSLPAQPSLFFAAPTAARLAGDGGPVFAGVFGEPRGALPHPAGVQVLTGDRAARAGSPGIAERLDAVTLLFGPMGGIGAFLAIFVIAGTLGLSLLQRGREIALLRAIGATPWQIRRMITGEAAVLAVLAALPGCLLSVPMAHAIRAILVGRGVAPDDFAVTVSPLPFLAAALAGLALCLLAAFGSARHATRIRAADALRDGPRTRRTITVTRTLAALVMLAGAAGIFLLAQHLGGEPGVAFQGLEVLFLMAAAALLSPLLTRLLEPVVGRLVAALARTTGWLAHANAGAARRRVSTATSALALTVGMAGYALLVTTALGDATARQSERRVVADRVLTGRDAPGLSADVATTVRRLPDAAVVSTTRSTTFVSNVLGTPDTLPAQAIDPATIGRVLDLGLREGTLDSLRRPGTAAVSRSHAGEHDWHVGSAFRGRLGDGTPVELTVGAIFDRPLGFGDVLLPADALAGHLATRLDGAVLIRARPGAAARLDRELAALVRTYPTVRVQTPEAYARAAHTSLAQNATGTYLALGVLVLFVIVSMVNTLVMGAAERRREFALLRLIGAGRGQIVRMICLETVIALVIGVLVGTAIAFTTLAGAIGALTGTVALTVPLTPYALIVTGTAAMALAASALPAVAALRQRPAAG